MQTHGSLPHLILHEKHAGDECVGMRCPRCGVEQRKTDFKLYREQEEGLVVPLTGLRQNNADQKVDVCWPSSSTVESALVSVKWWLVVRLCRP